MRKTTAGLAALCLTLAATSVTAATVVKTKELSGHISTMTVQGVMARMGARKGQYVIVDAKKQKFYAVNNQAKRVIDLTQGIPSPSKGSESPKTPKVNTELKHVGSGPKIAGYPTEHYQVLANGKVCEDTWLSPAATKDANLGDFLDAFYRFFSKQRRAYQQAGMQYSPCDEAQAVATGKYTKLGMAMKTTLPDGGVRQEVLSIKTGVDVPASAFDLPKGFPVMSRKEEMDQMRKKQFEHYQEMKKRQEQEQKKDKSSR